jgi:hypothetical protein
MEDGPLRSSDHRLKAFVKAEKWEGWKVAKPRMIFPRSPRYNLHLSTWLKPFEHWLWGNLKSRDVGGIGNSRVVAKGLNQTSRANLIVRKMRAIGDCMVFEVDGKAFEAHVDRWQLLCEHAVYESAYPRDGDLKKTLNKQLRNFGRTFSGVKFSRDGGRSSGDVNTGMGNTLVMLAVVAGVMRSLSVSRWDTLVDGDNALLFLPRYHCSRVHAEFGEVALRISGHEMTLERPVSVVEEVRFGRSAPVQTERGWKMVRDWRRVLSHTTSSHVHLREPQFLREFLHGVALCERSLCGRVPVLWKFVERLRTCTSIRRNPRLHGLRDYEALGVDLAALVDAPVEQPDDLARQSFFKAFGVCPEEQVALEESLDGFSVRDAMPVVSYDCSELAWPIEHDFSGVRTGL